MTYSNIDGHFYLIVVLLCFLAEFDTVLRSSFSATSRRHKQVQPQWSEWKNKVVYSHATFSWYLIHFYMLPHWLCLFWNFLHAWVSICTQLIWCCWYLTPVNSWRRSVIKSEYNTNAQSLASLDCWHNGQWIIPFLSSCSLNSEVSHYRGQRMNKMETLCVKNMYKLMNWGGVKHVSTDTIWRCTTPK